MHGGGTIRLENFDVADLDAEGFFFASRGLNLRSMAAEAHQRRPIVPSRSRAERGSSCGRDAAIRWRVVKHDLPELVDATECLTRSVGLGGNVTHHNCCAVAAHRRRLPPIDGCAREPRLSAARVLVT